MKQAAIQALQHIRTTLAYQLTPEAIEGLVGPIQRALEPSEPLSDERIDYIADLVVKGMPEGIHGFLKSWGWRQFARAIIEDCRSVL